MYWILIILFVLYSIISTYMVILSLRRINSYEEIIINVQEVVEYSDKRLMIIDHTGHFEADDEIGFMFDEVKEIQSILNNVFENKPPNVLYQNEEKSSAEKEK